MKIVVHWKIKHMMKDIIALGFFASLANADERGEIYLFGVMNEKFLGSILSYPTEYRPMIRFNGFLLLCHVDI